MLKKPDTPRDVLLRRERSRQSKRRRREGRRVWRIELSDRAVEGLLNMFTATEKLSDADAADDDCIRRELARHLEEQGLKWAR